ncbi:MAG TPA: hypothetical protein DIW17_11925 [Clostridiales bacterium]|nr:hypothetical protein [Clostridiales bacterium]
MFKGLKKLLRKVLPPPVNTFIREINRLSDEQRYNYDVLYKNIQRQDRATNELFAQQETLSNRISDLLAYADKIEKQSQVLGKELLKISSQIKKFDEEKIILRREIKAHRAESVNKQMYYNLTERNALVDSFAAVMNKSEDFEGRFLRLINGLDVDSIDIIVRILWRMQKILDGNTNGLDLFTVKEQEALQALKDDFNDRILKISDSLYYYDKYFLPCDKFDSSVFYYRYGLEYVKTIGSVRNRDVIDAGGYIGDTALILSPLTDKKVYVFEPAPENYNVILKTIEFNGLTNVVPENIALSSESGTVQFSIGERSSCDTLTERPGYHYVDRIKVEALTLDEYANRHGLDVGLIKVDIEGGERKFLQGAMKTITKFRPILLISIYHNAEDFLDIKPMLEDLNLGYTFKFFKPINNAIVVETVLIAEVD